MHTFTVLVIFLPLTIFQFVVIIQPTCIIIHCEFHTILSLANLYIHGVY